MAGLLNLDELHRPVATLLEQQLEQVSLIFERQLASDRSAVNSLCMHVEQYRGKMLRPTLVLLSGLVAGGTAEVRSQRSEVRGQKSEVRNQRSENTAPSLTSDLRPLTSVLSEKHRIIAAVTEMIHMATLVHDDVLDEAEVRRRGSTVNHLWGNETAVILGDYLISNAFHLCSTAGDPAINLALGQVTNTLCEGELVQLHHRNDYSIDEATYLEIVSRKTASLIGECCRLGASISGADDRLCLSLRRFGINLGIAFQIQDDLLDLVGDETIVGKSLGKDLDKGKLTLPVIYYLSQARPADRGEALRMIEDRDIRALQAALMESGVVSRASATALSLVEQAKAELPAMPASPARDLLVTLADAVVTRAY